MPKKIITVFGATGAQGGSAIDALLKDDTYIIRGVTRKLGQERAAALETAQGINIATAALGTLDTLEHLVYSTLPDASRITSGAVKTPHYESKARVEEYIESRPALRAVTTFVWPGFYAT
ncbi:hypothetical protein F4801DRAFT_574941 [Xylaria longipes]|nr:hypothetical protein F4801DRAFT_574941 [Xylaria longipes]